MSPENLPPDEPIVTSPEISRRKLLKVLTAAGAGASTVVLLSGQWAKPVAAGGRLAPHAQTSQPIVHSFVSGTAQQNPSDDVEADLLTSVQITPADPNIPIVAKVYADITPTNTPAAQTLLTTLNANTDAAGTATFPATQLDTLLNCQTVMSGSTTVTVVFTFANAAQGTGSLTATTDWSFGC